MQILESVDKACFKNGIWLKEDLIKEVVLVIRKIMGREG